jgi:hypothetical protein
MLVKVALPVTTKRAHSPAFTPEETAMSLVSAPAPRTVSRAAILACLQLLLALPPAIAVLNMASAADLRLLAASAVFTTLIGMLLGAEWNRLDAEGIFVGSLRQVFWNTTALLGGLVLLAVAYHLSAMSVAALPASLIPTALCFLLGAALVIIWLGEIHLLIFPPRP